MIINGSYIANISQWKMWRKHYYDEALSCINKVTLCGCSVIRFNYYNFAFRILKANWFA